MLSSFLQQHGSQALLAAGTMLTLLICFKMGFIFLMKQFSVFQKIFFFFNWKTKVIFVKTICHLFVLFHNVESLPWKLMVNCINNTTTSILGVNLLPRGASLHVCQFYSMFYLIWKWGAEELGRLLSVFTVDALLWCDGSVIMVNSKVEEEKVMFCLL